MKKVVILIIGIFSIFLPFIPHTYCNGSYAKIVEPNTYLYKTASSENNIKNIICIMENTYYVEIILTYDEDFYKVNYNGVSGYVLRNKVKKVSEVPENPYPKDVKMMTVNNNVYLRSSPEKTTQNNLTIIPSNTTNLRYVGEIYGEQLDDFRGNKWYFIEYQGIFGYIYCEYLTSISKIAPNIEQLSFLNTNDFDDIINPLSDGTCAIIICTLLLPCLLIILLIYKKPKKKSSNKFKEKVVVIKEINDKL